MQLFPDPMRAWREAEAELQVMLAAKQRGERFDGNLDEARMRVAEAHARAHGPVARTMPGVRASGRTATGN